MNNKGKTGFPVNKLSPEEIENPHLVFKDFFDLYALLDIRIYLRELELGQNDSQLHSSVCDHLERLVEAAWILHDKKSQRL